MNERMINKAIKTLGSFIFPYGLAIVSACITLFQCADNNFWGDESYTILMVNGAKSFIDVATCDIANPPFFFLIFRLFTLILGKKYWVYHFVSAFPTILLLLFSVTCVRKSFGNAPASIFILFLTMTSTGRIYSVEVRMYAWAAFFVVICFYEGYRILVTRGTKLKNWVVFCVGGIGAAYSHYFAFAGIIILYFFVFLRLVIYNKKNIWKCIVAIVVSIIGYLPWITVFVSAVTQITGDFWISSTVSIKEGFEYIFDSSIVLWFYILLLISFLVYISISVRKEKGKIRIIFGKKHTLDDDAIWMSFSICGAAIIILIFEIVYGHVFSPVFVTRYIYPVGVAVWLSVAMLIGGIPKKSIKKIAILLLSCLILISYGSKFVLQIKDTYEKNKETVETIEIVNGYIKNNKVFILTDNTHYIWTVLKQYFPSEEYGWIDKETKYNFSKDDTDIVLLFLNEELGQEDLLVYEENIGMKMKLIQNSSFADSYYYLYMAVCE